MYECSYQAMQIQEKNFYCFYKLTFPRKKIFVMALIKGEILILLFSPKTNKQTERTLAGTPQQLWPITAGPASREVLYRKSCSRNQFLFCKNNAFQNTDFFLKRKKLTQHVYDFPSLSRRGNELVEFSTQKLFQIRACVISERK